MHKKLTPVLYTAAYCFLIVFGLLLLVSCGVNASEQTVILSQKKTEPGRMPITILVKNAFAINNFEKKIEEVFPTIDIIQVGNYTRDMGISEYAARLEHDDLTDIVITWPLDVGKEYWEDRLIDLSGMNFTGRYKIPMLNDISRDGTLYYLPGPAQIRGLVYNKTLFKENGWSVPQDFEGFLQLCADIKKTGIKPLQLGFANGEVLDTAFIGFNYAACFSKPHDIQWISEYNNGNGNFSEHFAPALDVFQRMIDEGIWEKNDLFVDYSQREKMLFSRQCAMVEDSVLISRMGFAREGSTDEFGLMPFFNPGNDGDWARLYMVCYIGVNKKLAKPENKKKYDTVMKLMDYISTPEGQEVLASDTGGMFSSLAGVKPPDVPEIEDLVPALSHGRYAVFHEFKNVNKALREGLAGMILGTVTKEELAVAVDAQNKSPVAVVPPLKLGTATADFSLIDTGNFVTDCMKERCGSEIALFLDGGKDGKTTAKGIAARLYAGDVTTDDLLRILPDLRYGDEGSLLKIKMTGEDLIKTLEYAIPVDNNVRGWFYYFSGLRISYDPAATPGTRIRTLSTADGKSIVPDQLYTIAVSDNSVPNEFIVSRENMGTSIKDVLSDAIQKAGTISPANDQRFILIKK